MFYIALSFLVGVLWIKFKVISISLILTLLLLIMIKRLNIIILSLMFISAISSFFLISSYNQTEIKNLNSLYSEPFIDDFVSFKSFTPKSTYYTGILNYKNKDYRYFYKALKSNLKQDLTHKSCRVKGEFKFDKEFLLLNISTVQFKSCQENSIFTPIYHHQNYITKIIHKSGVTHPERILALITGDTSLIDEYYKSNIRDIGIYHLLAISGTHVGTIIVLVYQLLVRLNIPLVLIKGVTILLLLIYAVYTGFVPSAMRAISIAIIILMLPIHFRKSSIHVLSFIFVLMIVLNPQFINHIGFQFSFLISLFIILTKPYISGFKPLKCLFIISFLAQLGSIVINTYHFNQFQWIGLLSNFIFVPFYSLILFPSVIIYFILIHIFQHSFLLNTYINILFKIHDWIVHLFLNLNHFKWYIPKLNQYSLLILIILTLIFLYILVYRGIVTSVISFLIVLIIFTHLIGPHYAELTLFDVGQGDSILFKTKSNKNVLIDTGGKRNENVSFKHNNIAKYKILPSIKKKGITTINYLVITHPHADHMGELIYFLNNINVNNLVLNIESFPLELLKEVTTKCKEKEIKIIDVNQVKKIEIDNSKISFLNSFIPLSDDKNEHSIVTLIQYNDINILLMGDATVNNEDILMKRYNLPKIDILKVGHHGSRTSSSELFIKDIEPKISLISSGKNNKYHLPNLDVIQRLKYYGSKVFDTQDNGELTINLDEEVYIVYRDILNQKSLARESIS
ncbi:DNA internalization-related competence protein ComEC/Rec2 [Staphylococcus epidermidis]|uniref:DNA internalization-related competence protein ComEC/Rec2 n=2 Tax=Staphylococcus epidermidis TaxID=1282 RepID=UPI001E324118|nr:DNA internalization-related competence protein ComEC/Rec2 [Staphylococcus epidermidis]MCD8886211.1 DNA internalization-related competence protein ComEC/Rec2 [Staphylococcus epidermidis]MCG2496457.1 DNA internalization-related competence protein ComEC/Rec2 [Staphylococcus epidermidis]MCG2519077.1 DNA internalization-related competence protein ComEC/Rec2 [Staphylococcus epidermidis]